MDVEKYVTATTLTNKVSTFLVLIFADICLSCGTLFADAYSAQPQEDSINAPFDKTRSLTFFATASSIQVGLQISLIFWYFFLVWKTFLFRFGNLYDLLFKEMRLLWFVPVNFVLYFIERLLRLHYIEWNKISDVVTLYNNGTYMFFFWARNLFSVVMFAFSIKAAIQITHPSYYRPGKWLEDV